MIDAGFDANPVVLDESVAVQATMVAGQWITSPRAPRRLDAGGWARARFRDDCAIAVDASQHSYEVPRIPASVGALIFDAAGRLLVLKPNYKTGWTIPGGQMDATGESPWEACMRETIEECGLEPASGRLVCVDFRRPKPSRPGGMRFLFDCGTMTDGQLGAIRLQADEIDDFRLAELDEALALLSGPIRRRVAAGVGATRCVYLEDGRPVAAVRA